MKRCFSVLLCLILTLLLAGCAGTPPEPPAPTQESAAVTEAATLPPAEPPLPELEPIHTVTGLSYDSPYGFHLLDERTAVISRYEYPDGDYMDSVGYLDVVDLYNGTVTATVTLDSSEYLGGQYTEDGTILVTDYEKNLFQVLDEDLNRIRTIPVPNTNGLFSGDLSKYYYETCGVLHVLDTATGLSAAVEAVADYRFSALNNWQSATGTIVGAVSTTRFGYGYASVVFDPDSGELFLLNESYGVVEPTASGICCEIFGDYEEDYTFRYTDLETGTTCEIPGEVFGSSFYLMTVKNSDYFVSTAYTEDERTLCDLYCIGDSLTVYHLDEEYFTEGLLSLCQSPDGKLVGMQRYGDGYSFCIFSPDRLPFEEVCQPVELDAPAVDPAVLEKLTGDGIPSVPESLAELRVRADAMEEAYGITILLSGQCEEPIDFCGFPATTTDKSTWMDEHYYIENSLNELESALQLYPEGFFRQFRNEAGEYGLLVMLVESFSSENNAIGVHYTLNEWQCVAVDISWTEATNTYCHEIWHATENKIQSADYNLLDEETWSTYNPEGFSYSLDYGMGYVDDTEWTYLSSDFGAGSYFVDPYSRVDGKEDRARLMEYVMAYPDVADDLMTAPALRRKLQAICDAVRQGFDTTGWSNVWWERYTAEP